MSSAPQPAGPLRKATLSVGGMTCSSCTGTVERALLAQAGVVGAQVALLLGRVVVSYSPACGSTAASLVSAVEDVGFDAHVLSDEAPPVAAGRPAPAAAPRPSWSRATLSVEGMTCSSCTGTVEAAVRRMDGTKSVQVALLLSRATVVFDGGVTSAEAIRDTIDSVGFEAAVLSVSMQAPTELAAEDVKDADARLLSVSIAVEGEGAESGGAASAVIALRSSLSGVAAVSQLVSALRGRAGVLSVTEEAANLAAKGWEHAGAVSAAARVSFDPTRVKLRQLVDCAQGAGGEGGEALLISFSGAQKGGDGAAAMKERAAREREGVLRALILSFLLSFPVFVISMLVPWVDPRAHIRWGTLAPGLWVRDVALAVITAPVQFGVGWRFIRGATKGIIRGKCTMGMDFLIATGTLAAYAASLLTMILQSEVARVAAAEGGAMQAPPAQGGNGTDPGMDPGHAGHARALMGSMEGGPAATYFETSAVLITFVILGKWLELTARSKTTSALEALAGLAPSDAILVVEDEAERAALALAGGGGGEGAPVERRVPIDLISPGDLVKVLPGSAVPADGLVEAGCSEVDESMLTGEPMPVSKGAGDEVTGATVNRSGLLLVRVSRVGGATLLSQIVSMVEGAQETKAPMQAFADRISGVFAPCVLAAAIATLVGWLAASGAGHVPEAWLPPGQSRLFFAVLFAISVLVIACPCALGLATPTAVMVGTGVGARLGVLIKSGEALEAAARARALIFDKTGTLTEGKPALTELTILPAGVAVLMQQQGAAVQQQGAVAVEGGAAVQQQGAAVEEGALHALLGALAGAEGGSEHPLARAIVEGAHALALGRGRALEPWALDSEQGFVSAPGLGLAARVTPPGARPVGEGGKAGRGGEARRLLVGNAAWLLQHGCALHPRARARLLALQRSGRTGVLVATAASTPGAPYALAALLGVSDRVKPGAARVVTALRGLGLRVLMCTGDAAATAEGVAAAVGIAPCDVRAGVLPEGKLRLVRELQGGGGGVAMVGDGINDSPALAAANVGIAVGAGAQIALAAAGIVLVRENLDAVVTAIHLARAVVSRIRFNFAWALGYNVLGIPLAAGILFPVMRASVAPEVAGLAMALSSVSVVASSLLLRRYAKPVLKDASAAPEQPGSPPRDGSRPGGWRALSRASSDAEAASIAAALFPPIKPRNLADGIAVDTLEG